MSLEFIEVIMDKYFYIYNQIYKNIYKNIDNKNNQKLLGNTFIYIITNNSLGIFLESNNKIKWYDNCLKNPIINEKENNKNINKIYDYNYELTNLSLYKQKDNNELINDNSILFTQFINNSDDLLLLSKLIEKNCGKIRVIIVREINSKINNLDLVNFVSNNIIPIYIINKKIYDILVNNFIKPKNIIFNNNKFKFNISNKEDINDNKNEIIENEGKNLKNININYIKEYNEEMDESRNLYHLANIKLAKRLICDILYLNSFKISELENIFCSLKDIVYIFEVISMEYYFNIENNLPNQLLKKKLQNYLISLNEKNINKKCNEWLICYIDKYSKIKKEKIFSYNNYLSNYNIDKANNEKKLFTEIYNSFYLIIYDKILFLSRNFAYLNNEEYFIKINIELVQKMIKHIIENLENDSKIDNKKYITNCDYFESLFLFNIINKLYKYYIDDTHRQKNIELFENNIILGNILDNLKNLISRFFKYDKYIIKTNIFNINNNFKRNMERKTLQIKYAFDYFDLCLLLFLKSNKNDLFEYWIKSNDKMFKFYCNYTLLSIEKNYKEKDYKEKMALIYYITQIINSPNIKVNSNDNFKMKINHFNAYKINEKEDFINYSFNYIDEQKNNYNKLAIFCLDNNDSNKYIFQDIIDVNDLKRKNNSYKIKLNKEIYFVPLKNVTTCLYSFEHKSNKDSIIRNKNKAFNFKFMDYAKIINEYDNLKKYEELPKYSWNIGYNNKKFILLSEDNNLIYTFNHKKNISSLIKKEFNIDNRLNNIDNEESENNNRIVEIISLSSISSSFLLTENGEVFCIEKNKNKYRWLSSINKDIEIKSSLKIPIIPKIKVVSISANYISCYIIDNNGNLYSIGDIKYSSNISDLNYLKNWQKIPLPENNKRFLQCSIGKEHLLCLVEDNNGKGKIYAKGENKFNQCGILSYFSTERREFINDLIQCQEIKDLNFKSISANNYLSAAITTSGDLYIWGSLNTFNGNNLKFNSFILVRNENNLPMLADKIEIKDDKLFTISRILENNNYIKKLFSLELKQSNFDFPLKLREIKLSNLDDSNSRIIPIKICIGNDKSYILCIDENNLIKEINENERSNQVDSDCGISISNYIDNNCDIEKMKEIYYSDNLNKFISLYNSLSDKNISRFVEVINEIKKERNEKITIENLDYNQFIDYLKGKNNMIDLLNFFLKNENNEIKTLFNYLKMRISLIEENLIKYIFTSIEPITKKFFQKILSNNNFYISEKLKIEYFNALLSNLTRKSEIDSLIGRSHEEQYLINVDRYKATSFYDKYNENSEKIPDIELNETIFGQVFHYFEYIEGKKFLLNKNERLFNVRLIGENAIDAGGPYREVISYMCGELQSNYIDLFIKTPNNENNLGLLRDKYMINPNSNKNIDKKAYEFIGKLIVLAISSGEALNFNLHPIIWKGLLEQEITFEDYETVDITFFNNINDLDNGLKIKDENLINKYDLNFVIENSNKSNIELKPNGEILKVNLENLEEYINLSKSKRIKEIEIQIEYIKNGIYSAIDRNILQILNWNQLEEIVCGKNELDIKDFKEHTIYQGYKGDEEIIKWFWEWLEKSNDEIQFKYLKFVSGRTRLQKTGFGFKYEHKIIKVSKDNLFPKADTCFFSLKLPNYDSQKIFIEKMTYAIENCSDISDR